MGNKEDNVKFDVDEKEIEPIDGDEDEYEEDGFIVDDVDEEEPDDEERQKKKKRKNKEEYQLDEDDYELLEYNNVIHRRKDKKFKRLKKAHRNKAEQEEFDGSGEGALLEDIAEEEEEPVEEEDGGEEDEMADFIVDEEFDETRVPVRQRKLKRMKSRQAPAGVSSSALQEAHEIFGDVGVVDKLLEIRKEYLDSGEWRERRLEDEFEPIVLSEKYMTEKDDQIRELDVPERMQISEESTGSPPLDEISIKDERNWIFNQLAGVIRLSVNKDDIIRFLELHHVQKLDIAFIAMYRKEECLSLLKDPEDDNPDNSTRTPTLKWHKVLWAIQDLDRKWLLLQKRKSALQLYYNKRFEEESRCIYDERKLAFNQPIFESIMKSLEDAESEREVDDVDSKFNLHFPPGEVGVDLGHYKRPKRKSLYSICKKHGLYDVTSKFGYSSEQFGLQLLERMRMDELEDTKGTPEGMASTYTCSMFESPQDVLKGARHIAAVEISCEPCVRKYVRSDYLDNVVISTRPTPDGNVAIDSFHQFSGVKWLREKPLTGFGDAQWLLIQKAEEEKLLQVTIKLPEEKLNKLITTSTNTILVIMLVNTLNYGMSSES